MTNVCVITINFNSAKDTAKLLDSLNRSSLAVKTVVVDNTPNDPELERCVDPFENVSLLRAEENLGFAGANNLGFEWAELNYDFEYVFILNNDAIVQPDTIETMRNAIEEKPNVAIIAPRIVLAEDASTLWYGGGDIDWKRGGARTPGTMASAESEIALTSRKISFVTGCAMFMRADTYRKIGGFDPAFFMYEEDVDFSIRAQKIGELYYCCEALVQHRVGGSLRKSGDRLEDRLSAANPSYNFHAYHWARGSVINARKHAHGKSRLEWFIFFPPFVLFKMIKASFGLGASAFRPVFSGLWDGFKENLGIGK